MLESSPQTACQHCGTKVQFGQLFCCSGCQALYEVVQNLQSPSACDVKKKHAWNYLEDPNFLSTVADPTVSGGWSIQFYLENVQCAACLSRIERLAYQIPGVNQIRLQLGTSVVTVEVTAQGSLAEVAAQLHALGYPPHVFREDHEAFERQEQKLLLIRLGVAGACAGNTMLLAIALYAGAQGWLADGFRWISFFLFLPVFFWSAIPFYQSALVALKQKTLSLDVPVVFGLIVGAMGSFIHLVIGDEGIYFDSLSSLVFLLLCTRYFLKRVQSLSFRHSRMFYAQKPSFLNQWDFAKKTYQRVSEEKIQVGDAIYVMAGEEIPVDGVILQGYSSLDCAFLTGESQPRTVQPQDRVEASSVNLDAPLVIQVTQSGLNTRRGRILSELKDLLQKKARITVFADRVARYFVTVVVILCFLTLVWGWFYGWKEGLNAAIALAIVACPCTFALMTPLVFSLTLGRLAQVGILVKSPEVLEKMTKIQAIFLDKTGTLTQGTPEVIRWQVPETLNSWIFALESCSRHPVAQAIVRYLSQQGYVSDPTIQMDHLQETLSCGIQAKIQGQKVEVRRAAIAQEGTELDVFVKDQQVGHVVLKDTLRPDSQEAVTRLQSLGLKVFLLSGDHRVPVLQMGEAVGLKPQACFYAKSPEQKRDEVARVPQAMMVGDGANDAMALAQAFVGVSVHCGVDLSLKAADIHLSQPGVQPLYDVCLIAQESLHVVQRNLVVSVIYNGVAGALALLGHIHPLTAAVLMPLSASTVLVSSLWGTRSMKQAFDRLGYSKL